MDRGGNLLNAAIVSARPDLLLHPVPKGGLVLLDDTVSILTARQVDLAYDQALLRCGGVRPMRLRRNRINIAALVAAFATATAVPAHAEQRMVSVNGVWLGPQELALADRNAGYHVPNGYYWYDASSGYWGLVGGPVLGQVSPAQPSGREQGWYHAGPGGYSGSDGSCSYYMDPQTGASVMSGNC